MNKLGQLSIRNRAPTALRANGSETVQSIWAEFAD
jgi:hypothetical protein